MNPSPAEKNRRVLIIDDNRSIHEDFRKILAPADAPGAISNTAEAALFGGVVPELRQARFEVDSAYQGQEGVQMVTVALAEGRPYALAFVDVRMPPGWDGVETVSRIWKLDPGVQVVLCTAYSDYSWSEMDEKLGQQDGLLILKKPFDSVEALQMTHALTEKWWLHRQSRLKMEELEERVAERTRELQENNQTLHRQKTELRLLFDFLPAMISFKDAANRFMRVNRRLAEIVGKPVEEVEGKSVLEIFPHDAAQYHAEDLAVIRSGVPKLGIVETVRDRDGHSLVFQTDKIPIFEKDGRVAGILVMSHDITARKLAENALRESNEKFVQLADNISDAFWIRSADLRELHYVSPAFERIWGRPLAYLHANPQQWTELILAEDRERVKAAFASLAGEAVSIDLEYRIVRPDAVVRWVRVRGFQIRDEAGQLVRLSGIVTDITDHKRLQDQLVQSQRLESVGKLAGGVAHEFNSILTAIIGQSELLLGDLPAGSASAGHATEIKQAADRAAVLTRQLLAYGRKQRLETVVLDLNRVVDGMIEVFRPLVGLAVDTEIIAAPGLRPVKADAEQIEHVIVSLVVNAGEAMPNGGKLTLETANVAFRLDSVGRPPDLKPGDYVMLAITDTGVGMTAEVQAKLFEPFFTTKGIALGAGLSLSTCYGIMKQSGGHISVHSEPGRGTTFKMYLPQVESLADSNPRRVDSPDLPRGTETILLVEADPALRGMATALLGRLGYTVLAAADGTEALRVQNQHGAGPIDLLFTDLVMPHLNGTELADRVQASFPHLRVLFTSAYPDQAVVPQSVPLRCVALLQKPFTPSALARKLREVLDRAAEPPGATGSGGRPSPFSQKD